MESAFGGKLGHSFDLTALDSNAMRGKEGMPLPHFSPHPSPQSRGVNVFAQDLHIAPDMTNPYVFPSSRRFFASWSSSGSPLP